MPNHSDEQITLWEYMADPLFKQWMMKPPPLKHPHPRGLPWRVWAQRVRGGNWAKREFPSYAQAFNFTMKLKKAGFHDAALSSRVQSFHPPVVKRNGVRERYIPAIVGQHDLHRWCPHCRRPTVFTIFTRHHAFKRGYQVNDEPRCTICGTGLKFLRRY